MYLQTLLLNSLFNIQTTNAVSRQRDKQRTSQTEAEIELKENNLSWQQKSHEEKNLPHSSNDFLSTSYFSKSEK